MLNIETKLCFQVGLIEARERHARIHWHKQRVEIFAAVILVFIPRYCFARRCRVAGKDQLDCVFSGFRRQAQVSVLDPGRNATTVQLRRMQNAIAIVDQQITVVLTVEGERLRSFHGRLVLLDCKGELIVDVR